MHVGAAKHLQSCNFEVQSIHQSNKDTLLIATYITPFSNVKH